MERPKQNEYAAFYQMIIDPVPNGDIIDIMSQNLEQEKTFLSSFDEAIGNYRYAPEKWMVKEVLQHVIDTERIMSYRALRIVRGDQLVLAGFDENAYVDNVDLSGRTIQDLAQEYAAVRTASIFLFKNITPKQSILTANANGYEISVRGIAYVLVGHAQHHFMILKERYLKN